MKTCIFDLDGTVLDTLEDLADSCNYALKKENLPERSIAEVRSFVGNGMHNLIGKCVPEGTSEEVTARVFDTFKEYYTVHCNDKTAPYPGICELMQKLSLNGYRLAVVSNKSDYSVQKLIQLHFGDAFDAVCGEKEGIRKKPAPDSSLEVMKSLASKKEECVFIGDSDVDFYTAQNVGIPCITVTWGFRDREQLEKIGISVFVDSTEELFNKIGELIG